MFADSRGAAAALAAAGTGQVIEYEPPAPEGPRGLKAWVQQHKAARPGTAALQKQVHLGRVNVHACVGACLRVLGTSDCCNHVVK